MRRCHRCAGHYSLDVVARVPRADNVGARGEGEYAGTDVAEGGQSVGAGASAHDHGVGRRRGAEGAGVSSIIVARCNNNLDVALCMHNRIGQLSGLVMFSSYQQHKGHGIQERQAAVHTIVNPLSQKSNTWTSH